AGTAAWILRRGRVTEPSHPSRLICAASSEPLYLSRLIQAALYQRNPMIPHYRTIRVGDLDIHYDLADYTLPWHESPPEMFLLYHGYARNMLFWRPWVPLLAADYRVLWFDARGCGETTKPPPDSGMSFSQLAGDAIGLMDKLGIDRVHFAGESSGGIVGMTAALEHADRLRTLTLCDTPFKRSANIQTTYTLGEPTRAAAFDKYGVGGWCRQ